MPLFGHPLADFLGRCLGLQDKAGEAADEERFRKRSGNIKIVSVFQVLKCHTLEDEYRRRSHIVGRKWFGALVFVVVLVTTTLIGVETDLKLELYEGNAFTWVEFISFIVFSVELGLKFNQLGCDIFFDYWSYFDYIMVVIQAMDISMSFVDESSGIASILRIIRCLRIARLTRGQRIFKSLSLIIMGIVNSLATIFWVGVLVLIILYAIAVTLTTVCHSAEVSEFWVDHSLYVGSVARSYWTAVEIVTYDSWVTRIARPLGALSPGALIVIFIAIAICSLGVASCILSVMIHHIITLSKGIESDNQALVSDAEHFFYGFLAAQMNEDAEEEGHLSENRMKELTSSNDNFRFLLKLVNIEVEQFINFYYLLDADREGLVPIPLLLAALKRAHGDAKAVDLLLVLSFLNHKISEVDHELERAARIVGQSERIHERLDRMGRVMSCELIERRSTNDRVESLWNSTKKRQRFIAKVVDDPFHNKTIKAK